MLRFALVGAVRKINCIVASPRSIISSSRTSGFVVSCSCFILHSLGPANVQPARLIRKIAIVVVTCNCENVLHALVVTLHSFGENAPLDLLDTRITYEKRTSVLVLKEYLMG